ncbi:MAG TPA: inositol monophosphatase family protein [Spirochaetota bacterium]|nr:inositol monophosphatase family protein [Spirochaetota bacterium]HPS85776.1 inositol monophosphatase family protein [Spirochaetota bacterium]
MNHTTLSQNDIKFFLDLVNSAGSTALQMQRGILEIQRKEDSTIVTQADIWVQNYLTEKISERFNDFQIISEEKTNYNTDFSRDRISVILDPIDGTAMFSMHLPIWCISIGIFKGYTPIYGFVFSPGSDLLFYNDDNNSYLNGKKLISDPTVIIEKETNIFYSSEIRGVKINFPGKVRNLGSTALHACLTADNSRNRLLAFIGKSYLWDWAGAIPILIKAGVKLKYLNGSDLDYKAIIENNFELEDYAVAYNAEDFALIKNIFNR